MNAPSDAPNLKDMPCVTVEQFSRYRTAALEIIKGLEEKIATLQASNEAMSSKLNEDDDIAYVVERPIGIKSLQYQIIDPIASGEQEGTNENYQSRVGEWMIACFGETISADSVERNHRFLEEALELVQSLSCTSDEAHKLVDYVFGRPVGEPSQEVGGVMVTLAALCRANELNLSNAAESELARVWTKVDQIREKQKRKPALSPLPGCYPKRSAITAAKHPVVQPIGEADEKEIDTHLIDRLSKLLAEVAIALKGPEPELVMHGYHDLAEVAAKMRCELEIYRQTYGEESWRTDVAYPFLPCSICKGVEGCDHSVPERAKAFYTHPITDGSGRETPEETLQAIANSICSQLPDGFVASLCMENGAAWINLESFDSAPIDTVENPDASLLQRLNNVVAFAQKMEASLPQSEDNNHLYQRLLELNT